jgi:ankyrin repeat protein
VPNVFGLAILHGETDGETPLMFARTNNTALNMCAQDIFMIFLSAAIHCVATIGGDTTISGGEEEGKPAQRLMNSQMEKLASVFQSSGLGTLEDAYMCIVPILNAGSKLPPIGAFYQLLGAAMEGDSGKVEHLLATGQVDINAQDDNGRTALSWAAQAGNPAVVRSLLQCGTENRTLDVNIRDRTYNRTPLMWAADRGHEDVVRLLLEDDRIDDINTKDKSGSSALTLAENKTHRGVVKLLLEVKKVDPKIVDEHGRTTLMWAANGGPPDVVSRLLLAGVAIDAIDSDGDSALHYAVMEHATSAADHTEIVNILLATPGVKVNIKNKQLDSPIEAMLGAQDWPKPSSMLTFKLMLNAQGLDAARKDSQGRTLFMKAVTSGNPDAVRAILDHPSLELDLNAQNVEGNTVLSIAAIHLPSLFTRLLQIVDIDPHICNKKNESTLISAVKYSDQLKPAQSLLARVPPVDVNVQDSTKQTALACALKRTSVSRSIWGTTEAMNTIVLPLIRLTDHDLVDAQKWTALHSAVRYGNATAVDALIKSGHNINAIDAERRTPLHIAAQFRGNEGLLGCLMNAKPDLNGKTKEGHTARDVATIEKNRVFLSFLDKHIEKQQPRVASTVTPAIPAEKPAPLSEFEGTPLHHAAENGDLSAVLKELANNTEVNAITTHGGWTSLHVAAKNGHLEVARALLEAGADPTAHDRRGRMTPQAYALRYGHTDVAKAINEFKGKLPIKPPGSADPPQQVTGGTSEQGHTEKSDDAQMKVEEGLGFDFAKTSISTADTIVQDPEVDTITLTLEASKKAVSDAVPNADADQTVAETLKPAIENEVFDTAGAMTGTGETRSRPMDTDDDSKLDQSSATMVTSSPAHAERHEEENNVQEVIVHSGREGAEAEPAKLLHRRFTP